MRELTRIEVARKAIELADASPEFVYAPLREGGTTLGCMYVHPQADGTSKGGCIFGQALIALGLTTDEVARFERTGINGVLRKVSAEHLDAFDDLGYAMSIAQSNQDAGQRWTAAVQPIRDYFAARAVVVAG